MKICVYEIENNNQKPYQQRSTDLKAGFERTVKMDRIG